MREEVYNGKLSTGSRTYFFDVKKASTGNLYLDITESRKKDDGSFERHNIMIFPEGIEQFKEEILKIFYQYFKE